MSASTSSPRPRPAHDRSSASRAVTCVSAKTNTRSKNSSSGSTCLSPVSQRPEREVDVGLGVVQVERQSCRARPGAHPHARVLQALRRACDLEPHDRRRSRLHAEPGAQAVRQPDVVRVDRVDARRLDERERRQRAHPAQPRRRGVEPSRVVGQAQRRAVDRGPHVRAGVPPRRVGTDLVEALRADRQERGAARRDEPLVRGAGQEVEAAGVERQPPARLRRVHERPGPVRGGRRRDRIEVGQLARGGLHGADGDEMRAAVDRVGHVGERHDRDLDTAVGLGEEREQHGGEVALGGDDPRAVGDRRGDEPGQR